MTQPKSLTKIAYDAGFANLHDRRGQCAHLMGSIMSDKFEAIYFNSGPTTKDVRVFCITDPYDYDTCALYQFEEFELRKYIGGVPPYNPGAGGINIGNERPIVEGVTAVSMMETLASIPIKSPADAKTARRKFIVGIAKEIEESIGKTPTN